MDGYVGVLPIPYSTTEEHPTFFNLPDGGCSCTLPMETTFPASLDSLYHNLYELAERAKEAHGIGVNYLGLCCGASPSMIRSVAEAVGIETVQSKYSPDMDKHFLFEEEDSLNKENLSYRSKA